MTDGFVQVAADGAGKKIDNSEVVIYVPTLVGTWKPSTAYATGAFVRPIVGNDHYYKCTTGGTSGASEPNWPLTNGATVTDGTVTWTEQNTVERQRVNVGDPTDPLGLAAVLSGEPFGDAYGQVVRDVAGASVVGLLTEIRDVMERLGKLLKRKYHV